jgi:hypothetical protein
MCLIEDWKRKYVFLIMKCVNRSLTIGLKVTARNPP